MSDFIPAQGRYLMTFNDTYPATMKVGEVDVVLPDMPDERDMRNYDRKIKDQKYVRTYVPKDISGWPKHKVDAYAKAQWHRRLNGEWWLIKGEPYYFPGAFLTFLDFWTMHKGDKPQFRMSGLELFVYWYLYIERDPNLFGVYDYKCRRLGDTEAWLSIVWERTTRYRGATAGLQSYTDTEGNKNFTRLANGNANMPFFFRPNRSGSDKEQLAFMPPNEVFNNKKLLEKAGKVEVNPEVTDFIHSYIDYEATVTGKYDGQQLFTYFLDEIFKIPPPRMDVKKQWLNIKKVQSLFNDMWVFGRSILCSTIERIESKTDESLADTVEIAEYFWENSNPFERDENGRTYTGLARIFRGWQSNAPVDEWGFHQVEKAGRFRSNTLKRLQAKGDVEGILDLNRKEPGAPEDGMMQISADCPLAPEKCLNRYNQLKTGVDNFGQPVKQKFKVVEGNLVWADGKPFTKVVFVPSKNGRWHVSAMPLSPNNVGRREMSYKDLKGDVVHGNIYVPQNMGVYRMGVDPYDADSVVGRGSDGAFTVKRRFDPLNENPLLEYDEFGDPINVEDMWTNLYVCDYKYRHPDPNDFYWDVVKTCWWYGIAAFIEIDKPGLVSFMKKPEIGMYGFIQYEPPSLLSAQARRKPRQGAKATVGLVNNYVEKLVIYTNKYAAAQNHPRLLFNWARFVPAKRTKFDLTVASGFTELADDDYRLYDTSDASDSANSWKYSPYNEV